MILCIENDTIVKALQDKFNGVYPFLQLHFIKMSQDDGKPVKKMVKANPEQKLKELSPDVTEGIISIKETRTVAELINDFSELGLVVQVYRKSGTLWVETSLTEDWTLERQNREALLISTTEDFITGKLRKTL